MNCTYTTASLQRLSSRAARLRRLGAPQSAWRGRQAFSNGRLRANQATQLTEAQEPLAQGLPYNAQTAASLPSSTPGSTRPEKHFTGLSHYSFKFGEKRLLDPLFLRDSCRCSRCVDPSTKQKLFQTANIPHKIDLAKLERSADGWHVTWTKDVAGYDNHESIYSDQFLQEAVDGSKATAPLASEQLTLWDQNIMSQNIQFVDFDQYLAEDATTLKVLEQLERYGLVFVKNVPETEAAVKTIAERIGPLKTTFYGETWDVKSVTDAKNVAYTHQDLGFHMDLLCVASPFTDLHISTSPTHYLNQAKSHQQLLMNKYVPLCIHDSV
ncbi:hypothetical protein LTR28_000060 [Elasticomyces elasticus]|nr:hypothetical protein LTR28_000060 [Elasticomyces elasticus]